MQTDRGRFYDKIHKAVSGCWLWQGWRNKGTKGRTHGQFWYEKKKMGVHRASWLMHRGPIPDGMCVLHRCDVPHCVNPAHLFLGTKSQNQQDMREKGRGRAPEKFSKRTMYIACKRIEDGERQRDVARDMGISEGHLSVYRKKMGGEDLTHLRGVKT